MNILKIREELLKGKTIYDLKLNVCSYSRVSTDKDVQLNSLDNQVNYFKELIKSNKNWHYVNSYIDEGISGTTSKRENFLKMIEDSKNNKIDLILTKEISRFSRNTLDSIKYTQTLLSYGTAVLFLTDNINTIYPDSEFRLTIMASLAQDEVRKLSERVKFGIKRSIKNGKLGGSRLTGYNKHNGKLTINDQEKDLIKLIFNLYATNQYSFKDISNKLVENNYYTKKGKPYSITTLKKIITNPRYKGYYTANMSRIIDYKTHRKELVPLDEQIIYKDKTNSIPALIDEKLWDKVNEIYKNRKITKTNKIKISTYTKKLICKEHNTYYIRQASSKRKTNPTWQCNEYLRHGLKYCQSPIIKEEILNKIFIKELENIFNLNKLKEELLILYKETLTKKVLLNNPYQKQLSNLLTLLIKDIITKEEYLLKKKELKEQEQKLILKDNLEIIKINLLKENLNSSLREYINIFINKVIISKINNNRKHLSLEFIYNYKRPNTITSLQI